MPSKTYISKEEGEKMKQKKLYLDGKRQPQRFEKYAKEKFQNLKPREVKENMLNDGGFLNSVLINL